MPYEVDVLGGPDGAVGPAVTGAGRFGAAGLLRRRRPGTETYRGYLSGPAWARPVDSDLPLSLSPLPAGLLPLPAGFEPSTAAD
ncbi:hypothetical protein [Streptomyces sp. R08]|uniref:Uncharacterized protein n=1 Tax=Streptomyces sp. R08 TaxID=3238624 RepID=A0AB39M0C7_9ACTN